MRYTAVEAAHLVASLSLPDKIRLLSGRDFWMTQAIPEAGVPSIMLTDGPHGLRKQSGATDHADVSTSVPATCFPTAAALGSTWDPALLEEIGHALGRDRRRVGRRHPGGRHRGRAPDRCARARPGRRTAAPGPAARRGPRGRSVGCSRSAACRRRACRSARSQIDAGSARTPSRPSELGTGTSCVGSSTTSSRARRRFPAR